MTLVHCWNVNGCGGMEQSVLPRPEAPVNDGSNYNCLKVGNAAFIKFDYMLENLLNPTLLALFFCDC